MLKDLLRHEDQEMVVAALEVLSAYVRNISPKPHSADLIKPKSCLLFYLLTCGGGAHVPIWRSLLFLPQFDHSLGPAGQMQAQAVRPLVEFLAGELCSRAQGFRLSDMCMDVNTEEVRNIQLMLVLVQLLTPTRVVFSGPL